MRQHWRRAGGAAATTYRLPASGGSQPPPAGATPPAGQQPPGGGRAGGRGNAAATLFATTCAPCHGTDLAGGRAPTLFSERLLASNDDETLVAKIRDGVPNTAMVPFKGTLDDQQIWQLVAYIRTTAASLKDKPVFVPDPNNQIIKSERQTFRIEVVTPGLETPWGLAFLPDGRLLVTERPGRLRVIDKGKLRIGSRAGHAEGVGTPGLRHVGRGDSSAVRKERLDLSRVHRGGSWICGAASTCRASARSRCCHRRAREGPRWAAQSSVDDGLRPREDRQSQPLGRGATPLSGSFRPVYAQWLALWDPLPLRQDRPLVLQPGRAW